MPHPNDAIAAQHTIDREALRLEARRQTESEMQRTELQYERKADGLDWARRIVARLEAGEAVDMIARKWALEALGLPLNPPEREPGQDDDEREVVA